jgi:hypothetical protein
MGDRPRRVFVRRAAAVLAVIGACVCPTVVAVDPPITLISQLILNGSSVRIGNACSRLLATIGQPAPGFSSGGGFTLNAGFRSIVPAGDGDTIFFDGTEECRP